MVDAGWTPTVEFLGRLTKARILQAVREARGEDSAQLIDHMKKDIMAREAARLLEGSNWLPEPLRLEVEKSPMLGDDGRRRHSPTRRLSTAMPPSCRPSSPTMRNLSTVSQPSKPATKAITFRPPNNRHLNPQRARQSRRAPLFQLTLERGIASDAGPLLSMEIDMFDWKRSCSYDEQQKRSLPHDSPFTAEETRRRA